LTLNELLFILDALIPPSLAEPWDNCGMLVGARNDPVEKILVALNATPETIMEAAEAHCTTLITHHPLMIVPVKQVDTETLIGRSLSLALRRHVSIVALHTNWDKAPEGLNTVLAKSLKLSDLEPLGAFGVLGVLPKPELGREFAQMVKKTWKLSGVEYYEAHRRGNVRKVGLVGGSGGSLWAEAMKRGADLFITADMKYHDKIECQWSGLSLVSVDHGEMETVSLPALKDLIEEKTGLPVLLSSCPDLLPPERF
jgi:dinuclear metal center YbgI/SA1388 family protein